MPEKKIVYWKVLCLLMLFLCDITFAANGACGPVNNQKFTYESTSWGTYGDAKQCANGTTPSNRTFPQPGSSSTWICLGTSGGTNSGNCIAYRAAAPACG